MCVLGSTKEELTSLGEANRQISNKEQGSSKQFYFISLFTSRGVWIGCTVQCTVQCISFLMILKCLN